MQSPSERIDLKPLWKREGVFALLVVSYLASYAIFFPATYSIDDEGNILSLSTAISGGTVFLDQAGIDVGTDLAWKGHLISKFFPFHAALYSPFVRWEWRLSFLWGPLFVVVGAFAVRQAIHQRGLPSMWALLYFLNPALIYYSRTLLAAVPAAACGLWGAVLLFDDNPRPMLGAFALGLAALFHPWMIPFATVVALGWWTEKGQREIRSLMLLAAGASPAIAALAIYNLVTTGGILRTAYWVIGDQHNFAVQFLPENVPFYVLSLAAVPIGGWAVLSRRHAGSRTVGVAAAVVVCLASLYYYRDGRPYGWAGWTPGQRFLLPASLLACAPAASWLRGAGEALSRGRRLRQSLAAVALAGGICLSWVIGKFHQEYLAAHRAVQAFLVAEIPQGAHAFVSERLGKEFAPVNGTWTVRVMRTPQALVEHAVCGDGFLVWDGPPGTAPEPIVIAARIWKKLEVRSWIWRRDVWLAKPSSRSTLGSVPAAAQRGGGRV